jgi:putative oxygen-independent coproporphyrinogen III oxidase
MKQPPLALYVHMPWCVRKCPYCDFNSHQLKSGRPDPSYLQALLADFERESAVTSRRTIQSIFFGGGTPSLFAPDEFAELLRGFRQRATIAADAEVTLEANPGTIERGHFDGYREAGITRVSLGAQSFNATQLQRLGRIHSASETQRAVEELHAANLANFNLDLMYALPEQTLSDALQDLEIAISLSPRHISHYQLTLEPGTAFYAAPPPLPDEDLAWQMQIECQALLAERGFAQYEVSAYAQSGGECRHNLNYWRFGDYVGVGAGAHGKITDAATAVIVRSVKPKQPSQYLRAALSHDAGAVGERQLVPRAELPFEFMLNGLRLSDGFASRDFEDFTGLPIADISSLLDRLRTRGLLERTARGWRTSALGGRFLNDVQQQFLPQAAQSV